MSFRAGLRRALVAATVLLSIAAPASASDTLTTETLDGTPAWAIEQAVLYDGPGGVYRDGAAVPGQTRIIVDRCTEQWCQVRYQQFKGWMPILNISFGQYPRGAFSGPKLHYATGGSVCFYTGRNYTGAEFCSTAGTTVRDLKLYGIDNSFASVRVEHSTVMVCRDFNYGSYCTRITESTPVLGQYLYNAISSYRVY